MVTALERLAESDPVQLVRTSAVDALGSLAPVSDEAREALQGMKDWDDVTTRLVVLGSVLEGDDENVRSTALELGVGDRSVAVRRFAVRGAHRNGGPLAALRDALDDSDAGIRYEAACALYAAGDDEGLAGAELPELRELPVVALASVRAGALHPEAARVLAQNALHGWTRVWGDRVRALDPRIAHVFQERRNLRAGGRRRRNVRPRPTLPAVPDPLTLDLVLGGLATLETPGYEALAAYVGSDSEVVGGLAVFALAQLGGNAIPETSATLVPLLDTELRYVAAIALASDAGRVAAVLPVLVDGAVSTNHEGMQVEDPVIRDLRIVEPEMWRYATRPALSEVLARLEPSDLSLPALRRALFLLSDIEDPDEGTRALVERARELLRP
jgi:hypothetical protein